ncbi:unnamed protein product [Heligmosomoides polygyrus]|uniref:Sister chromatid cohesion protein DCC1 n=1 Tax=Heligmosomoides polygyrus TaxID=6339 RepID=A0A183FE84_HELPZ|nr:unnamed protein product [Heligmosomoides polygyrus]
MQSFQLFIVGLRSRFQKASGVFLAPISLSLTNTVHFVLKSSPPWASSRCLPSGVRKLHFCLPARCSLIRTLSALPVSPMCSSPHVKLVFRGDSQDEVVLCTASSSYFVKEVETSNALLIMPTLKVEGELTEAGEKFLTITPVCIPCVSLYRLRDLLHQNRLPWDWMEKDSFSLVRYSMEMLLDHVQMSEEELTRALAEMPVFSTVISLLEFNIVIPLERPLRSFLPEHITDAIIQWFLTKMCTKMEEGGKDIQCFDTMVAPLPRQLLGYFFFYFTVFCCRSSHLLGICVYSESVRGKFISYLSVEDLPENPRPFTYMGVCKTTTEYLFLSALSIFVSS